MAKLNVASAFDPNQGGPLPPSVPSVPTAQDGLVHIPGPGSAAFKSPFSTPTMKKPFIPYKRKPKAL